MTVELFEDNQGESWESAEELQQRDVSPPALPFLPVRTTVDNIVRTRPLSTRQASMGNINVVKNADPVRIIPNIPQRMVLRLRTQVAGVYLSTNESARDSGFYLPVDKDETWLYSGALYLFCGSTEPSQGCTLSWAYFLTED